MEGDTPKFIVGGVEITPQMINEYLRSLPYDHSRIDFIQECENDFCEDCGSLYLPCFCEYND